MKKKSPKKKTICTKEWLGLMGVAWQPQGAKGVAEPPLGAQEGGRSHPHFFNNNFLNKKIY
jgi:hypothetical protein